jgi:hypothetical protein
MQLGCSARIPGLSTHEADAVTIQTDAGSGTAFSSTKGAKASRIEFARRP